jgi:hypothetical protein
MFGKGTFKSSGNFRPSTSAVTENKESYTKFTLFNDAENAENSNDVVTAVHLYSKFINEGDNMDEGNTYCSSFFK